MSVSAMVASVAVTSLVVSMLPGPGGAGATAARLDPPGTGSHLPVTPWVARVSDSFDIPDPRAIAFDALTSELLVVSSSPTDAATGTAVIGERVGLDGQRRGTRPLPAEAALGAFALDRTGQFLVGANAETVVTTVGASVSGAAARASATRSIAVDPGSGSIFALTNDRLVTLQVSPRGLVATARTPLPDGAEGIDLLVFDPGERALVGYDVDQGVLVTFAPGAARATQLDAVNLGLVRPAGMTFGPTSDTTDAAERNSLYVVDTAPSRLVEVALFAAAAALPATETAPLLRTTLTSGWGPASPDPSGLGYNPLTNRLEVVDGEVEEMTIYAAANTWEVSLNGTPVRTSNTQGYSNEPTEIDIDPVTARRFVSDDDARRIYVVNPGPDGLLNTTDDSESFFSTIAFGSNDPEGVTYNSVDQHVYVVDGGNREVYEVDPGPNGLFDGVGVDDIVTQWDVDAFGLLDPEGISDDPATGNLFVISGAARQVIEFTADGSTVVRVIDISANGTIPDPRSGAGVAFAPASNGQGVSLYITDRGVDNDVDPNENDGRLFEMGIAGGGVTPNNPPTVSAGPDRVVALSNAANLDGTVTDDGQPVPPGATTTTWTQVSPASPVASITTPSSVDTAVTFAATGTYTFRLTGSDGAETRSDDVVVTVQPGGFVALDIPIVVGTDDAEEALSGAMNRGSLVLELVTSGSGVQTIGVRFAGVQVPIGASITNAWIQFASDVSASGATDLTIAAHDVGDSPAIGSTSFNLTNRPKTASTVGWVPAAWSSGAAGPAQQTPSLNQVVQQIVGRVDWVPGNAMTFIIQGSGRRNARAFETGPPPVLHLEYVQAAGNNAPVVSAGPDATVSVTGAATLDGTATDDGLPATPGAVTTTWTQVTPASPPATIASPSAVDTTATFTQAGSYTFRLSATDGDLTTFDDVVVTVTSANSAPTVSAGADLTVAMPNSATLDATVSDDGEPVPPGTVTTSWTQLSPTSPPATISTPSSIDTTVSFTAAGVYTFRLSATDGSLTTTDDVVVTVTAAAGLDVAVAAGADDAEEATNGTVSLTSSVLQLVTSGTTVQTVGLRFAAVPVPRGATVTNAWIQFTADARTSTSTNLTLSAHDVGNSPPITSAAFGLSGRTATTATVAWNPPSWSRGAAGPSQRTPSLNPLVQHVVNRSDWVSGNAMTFIIRGSGRRDAESLEGGFAPVLHVEFTASSLNSAPVVSAGADSTVGIAASATLDGSVGDDGLPNPPGAVTATWTQVGPTSPVATIDSPTTVDTTVSFPTTGTYTFRLTAGDGEYDATDDVVVTVLPAGLTTFETSIATGIDDAEETASGTMTRTSSVLELVTTGSGAQVVGIRFSGVQVPAGSVISDAWIQFTSQSGTSGATQLTVRAHDIGDAPTIGSANFNLSSRPRTAASVAWVPTSWSSSISGPAQRTPALTDVVQQVVGRADWASGNAVLFIIEGTGRRNARSFESGPAAVLHLEFAPSG